MPCWIKKHPILWVVNDTSQAIYDILGELGIMLDYVDRSRDALENNQLDGYGNTIVEEQTLFLECS
jgi:hypothetical protein